MTTKMSDVNNYLFGMMTVSSLEQWHTRDFVSVALVSNLGPSHFPYRGGSISYRWHYDPQGCGYCLKPEEYRKARKQRIAITPPGGENYFSKLEGAADMHRIQCRSVKLVVVLGLFVVLVPRSGVSQQRSSRKKSPPSDRAAAAVPESQAAQPAASVPAPKEATRRRDGAWTDPNKAEPAGTKYRTFHSQTIHAEVSYLIYLPPDYETAKDTRYPLVYWLHGGGGSQRTGENFIERLDAAIRSGKAPPMIAILVNGVGGSLFCDSIDGRKPVETVIVRDLIPHIDQTYRTHGTRRMRAIEGFSMGGFGAIHLGFKYPQIFGAVTALAHAPIRPNSGWQRVERVWQEGPFAGNAERFAPEDPVHLVEKNADAIRRDVRTRLIVGDADNPNTVARTKELHDKMTELRLPCELIVVPGVRHSYQNLYAELGDREFEFYRRIFAEQSRAEPQGSSPQTQSPMSGLYAGVKSPDGDQDAQRLLHDLKNDRSEQRDASAEEAWLRHGFSETQRAQIRAAFQWGIDHKFIPGGALLLIHQGEPVFREAFGLANLETRRPFTPDLSCRIASVTKPRTVELWNPWCNNRQPSGPAGLTYGYATRVGRFEVPLAEFVRIFNGITLETAEP